MLLRNIRPITRIVNLTLQAQSQIGKNRNLEEALTSENNERTSGCDLC